MEKLSKDVVMHVANLAKLKINDNEVEKYGVQLAAILTEIDKINKVEIDAGKEILIAPITHNSRFSEDQLGSMLSKEEIFRNASNSNDEYIIVPKVIE